MRRRTSCPTYTQHPTHASTLTYSSVSFPIDRSSSRWGLACGRSFDRRATYYPYRWGTLVGLMTWWTGRMSVDSSLVLPLRRLLVASRHVSARLNVVVRVITPRRSDALSAYQMISRSAPICTYPPASGRSKRLLNLSTAPRVVENKPSTVLPTLLGRNGITNFSRLPP